MEKQPQTGAAARTYGGVSADERRSQRRAALLDAALDLLNEGGVDTVTKRAVCARARLNDRYFYEQFADRDALLRVLAQELTAQGIEAAVSATLASASNIHDQIRAGVSAAFEFLNGDPRRPAMLRESHTNDVLYRARVQTQHTIAKVMGAVSRTLIAEPEFDEPDSEMAAYTLVAGTLELAAAWYRGEFAASQEHMVELVTRMLTLSHVHPAP